MHIRRRYTNLFASLLLFSSCAYHIQALPPKAEYRPGVTETVSYPKFFHNPKEEQRWGVYQRGYLIPEYTQTKQRQYPATKSAAEALLKERKTKLAPIIFKKYAFEPVTPEHYAFFSVLAAGGIVMDVTVIPLIYLCQLHPKWGGERLPVTLFPMTRMALNELIVGPSCWLWCGVPALRLEWQTDKKNEEELTRILKSFQSWEK